MEVAQGAHVAQTFKAVQTGEPVADAGVQWEAVTLSPEECRAQLCSPQLVAFLQEASLLCEEALQQNELADVLPDAFAGDNGWAGGSTQLGSATMGPPRPPNPTEPSTDPKPCLWRCPHRRLG